MAQIKESKNYDCDNHGDGDFSGPELGPEHPDFQTQSDAHSKEENFEVPVSDITKPHQSEGENPCDSTLTLTDTNENAQKEGKQNVYSNNDLFNSTSMEVESETAEKKKKEKLKRVEICHENDRKAQEKNDELPSEEEHKAEVNRPEFIIYGDNNIYYLNYGHQPDSPNHYEGSYSDVTDLNNEYFFSSGCTSETGELPFEQNNGKLLHCGLEYDRCLEEDQDFETDNAT